MDPQSIKREPGWNYIPGPGPRHGQPSHLPPYQHPSSSSHHHYSQHYAHPPPHPHHPPPPAAYHRAASPPRHLPSLTLQRPSHPNALPPLEYIRPGSVTDAHVPLGAHHYRGPPSRSSSRGSSGPQPPHPAHPAHPPHAPLAGRRASLRAVSPSTPTSDLARYAMTSDSAEGQRDRSRSPSHHSPKSSASNRTLPPLRASPDSAGLSRRPSMASLPDAARHPSTLSPIVFDDSRKRKDADGGGALDGFSLGAQSSLPPAKRHAPERDGADFKPMLGAGPASAGHFGGMHDRPTYAAVAADSRRILSHMPIPPQPPLTVFPVTTQYTWPAGATGADGQPSREAVDQALSSIRSSAGNGGADALGPPEIRLQPETLGSAGASPSLGGGGGGGGSLDDLVGDGSLDVPDRKEGAFSRSPELRVSHKLAERKRRKEMKELFDELRDILPADRGLKASKWEILTKAIDYVAHLKTENANLQRQVEIGLRERALARGDNPGAAWPPSYHDFASLPGFSAGAAQAVPAAHHGVNPAGAGAPASGGGTPAPKAA